MCSSLQAAQDEGALTEVTVSFNDPAGRLAGMTDIVSKDMLAAFQMWSPYLADSAGSLQIEINTDTTTPRASGSSVTSVFLGAVNGVNVFDFGAPFELRTGQDPNGAAPDVRVNLNVEFMRQYYWPNPLDGSAVAANKTDLVDVFAHEIGHGLGFNGWTDWATYKLPADYEGPFDSLISVVNGAPFFIGAAAAGVYGGPVPLTAGNVMQLGNATGAGADLVSDLMNGVVFNFGSPYVVSKLDVAILSDLGVPTNLSDNLQGSSAADIMFGGGGDDYMRGNGGNDSLIGGAGFDDINGNKGNDTCFGGEGDDWVVGGQDSDSLSGENGNDVVFGNLGDDTCSGGGGDDWVRGGQGDDLIDGGASNDFMSGDRGNDTIYGGDGADGFNMAAGCAIDRVMDFKASEGDYVIIEGNVPYTLTFVGGNAVIDIGDGNVMTLVGVSSQDILGAGWAHS